MAFATNNRASIITLLALLVIAAASAAFARSVGDDHASSPIHIDQANVKPELYHCALGCAYKSSAEITFSGSDAHVDNNYLGSCYNKCEESFQG
ncbi:hypothetical protein ACLB2K_005077 [Fragaria x ananassa]